MRTFEVAHAVVYVAKHGGDGAGGHDVLAVVVLGHPHEVGVMTWRVVGRDALLIDLTVLWKLGE